MTFNPRQQRFGSDAQCKAIDVNVTRIFPSLFLWPINLTEEGKVNISFHFWGSRCKQKMHSWLLLFCPYYFLHFRLQLNTTVGQKNPREDPPPRVSPPKLPDRRDGGVLPWRKTTCQGQFETCLFGRQAQGCSVSNGPWERGKKYFYFTFMIWNSAKFHREMSFRRYFLRLTWPRRAVQQTFAKHCGFCELPHRARMCYHFHQNKGMSVCLPAHTILWFIHRDLVFLPSGQWY